MRASDLSVSTKLGVLATVSLVALGVVGGASYAGTTDVTSINQTRAEITAASQQLSLLDMKESDAQIAERDALLATTDTARDHARQELADVATIVADAWDRVDTTGLAPDLVDAIAALRTDYATYLSQVQTQLEVLAQIDPAGPEAAPALQAETDRADRMQARINDTRAELANALDGSNNHLDDTLATVERTAIVMLVIAVLVVGALARLIARSVTRPLSRLDAFLSHAATELDLSGRLDASARNEFGRAAAAANRLFDAFGDAIDLIGGHATTLSGASEELAAVSTQMTTSAGGAARLAARSSARAVDVAGAVQTVSAATEEMTSSIGEIARGATDAAATGRKATDLAHDARIAMGRLGESSRQIDHVAQLIAAIAGQTNLLALNATIEAARAGESGKGFAVVATEVKDLANRSADATADIGRQVAAVQSDVERAVTSINEIADVIERMSESQVVIASAVEEQTATTAEISRSLNEVAVGTDGIERDINQVSHSSHEVGEAAANTNAAAAELAAIAVELHQLICRFTIAPTR